MDPVHDEKAELSLAVEAEQLTRKSCTIIEKLTYNGQHSINMITYNRRNSSHPAAARLTATNVHRLEYFHHCRSKLMPQRNASNRVVEISRDYAYTSNEK